MYSWKFLRAARLACAVAIGVGATALVLDAQGARAREWLTWGGDQERTGWNRNETAISKQNVRRLALRWKSQIDKEVSIEIESGNSMLTAPLVAQNVRTPGGPKTVLYTLSAANTLAALDAATGKPIWQRTIDRTVEPRSAANWICTNMSTATPVIDKAASTIYMISADGRLHGLDISTGEAKLVPPPEFVTPYSRNWSLNLVDGVFSRASDEDAAMVRCRARRPRRPAPCAGAELPRIQRRPAKPRPHVQVERRQVMARPRVPVAPRPPQGRGVKEEGAAVARRHRRSRRT